MPNRKRNAGHYHKDYAAHGWLASLLALLLQASMRVPCVLEHMASLAACSTSRSAMSNHLLRNMLLTRCKQKQERIHYNRHARNKLNNYCLELQ